MKLKSKNLTAYVSAFKKIIEESDKLENKIGFELSYWAIRNSKKLDNEELTFRTEKDKLLLKYGAPSKENPNQYIFKTKEKAELYIQEVNSLGDSEIEISDLSTKELSLFKETQSISSSINILLDVFIIDDLKEKSKDK